MNDNEALRFLTATANDPGVASASLLAIGDRQGGAAHRAVVEFGQDLGFDLDAADAQYRRQALVHARGAERDLTDAELTGVDGGVLAGTPVPTPMPSPVPTPAPGPTGIFGTIVAIGQAIDPGLNLFKGW